ncbi:cytidylyltransferase domain-containing protein [Sedimentibacter saalensis]|uniref:CMP-N-acetylneuraminic acid synthetase n=1 Tax=Sedimentibacter saalensis TaxID=130788 RepID=A0A562J834_9FIRM|nr:N-acylneuraminate cytidylyltransferase [Sedimentibacter saalensis]TWH79361.1 CMP-N-acetylneuraminic acid synthetase [Sedimentibacter saalensis]
MNYNNAKILAVIPARGGSKGIPRKNVRLMNRKPLISYSIENALSCKSITDIVVTTDDEEIISIAKLYDIDYIVRDARLADDLTTLDPVIYDAVIKMEEQNKMIYDVVITLQPTSPLLKPDTLNRAIESFINDDKDSYISAVNDPHLTWSKEGKSYVPNYEKRVNRQLLPPTYLETGSFFISSRKCVTLESRLGKNPSIFEVPKEESTDIDSANDWIVCEHSLKKKRIVFRADGYKELGMGHIYHCLTLAYNLTGHEVMFVTKEQYTEGVKKIQDSFMPYVLIKSDDDFYSFLKNWRADVVVNDCLNTEKSYVLKLKELTKRVITIEDLGNGAEYADAVINALYNDDTSPDNYFFGEKYVCLRDEFLTNKPKPFSRIVKNVLVIFGGTDPSNLTLKIYEFALKMHKLYPNVTFNFITGSGYDVNANDLKTIEEKNIYVLSDVKRISEYMKIADLAFTSQGRTVYELATLGVPSIVLAQNEREQLHTFAQMQNGFLNLGLGKDISLKTLESTFEWLVGTEQVRNEMRELMLKHDLKKGINNVIRIILKED